MATTKQIEEYLQKIRRLPSNKLCANCRIPSRLGFSAVCVKYQSFVCDLCKSSHQSYSHRTKSVTMSTWTMDEVKALDEKNGGGNEWCRAKWFARMSPSDAERYVPKEGDPLDNYKKLVHMVYEQAKYYDENGKPAASSSSVSSPAASPATSTTTGKPKAVSSTSPTKKAPLASSTSGGSRKKAADEDLLILDFESSVTVSPAPAASSSVPPFGGTSPQDEWGTFTTSSPQLTAVKPASSLSDDWTFQSATPPATSSSALPVSSTQAVQQPKGNPLLSNLQNLYQPQSPSAAFTPSMQQPGATMMAPQQSHGLPFGGYQPQQPVKQPGMMMPSPGMAHGGMGAGLPPMGMSQQQQQPIGSDPFAHLQSFGSAPSVMLSRTSSSTNGNAAPSVGAGAMMAPGNLARSASAPANDPFAGLI